ncbi:ECs_2282 family putative zinc-binding protein [Aliivibrio fischeri]|uniref:ECs_2282 family putative zinc-binding protein n=1 Tax=Aliivibrio fischeri TaxID=668 RepID=UPI0006D237C0|nr:hypothetical protein [Aliivibrio fischeri]USR97089.1 hypothetical protein AVFI_18055 [Aliivibrio fischeri ATCC 7744 = JCM 18803 = DSM 507]GGK50081.1 hypothetical protein GCM10007987_36430 [Aliivibrio fischeri]
MNPEKYQRSIRMLCPTCGCSDFNIERGADHAIEVMECARCNRSLTKDELLLENSEAVHENIQEVKPEILEDAADKIREMLHNAVKGNKNIRFK